MGHDAQIQMIASTIKVGQKLSRCEQGKVISQLTITLEGGAKSSLMPEMKATIKIIEQVSETLSENMKILTMEYKAVKRLSDQDDLLRGQ